MGWRLALTRHMGPTDTELAHAPGTLAYGHSYDSQYIVLPCCTASANQPLPNVALRSLHKTAIGARGHEQRILSPHITPVPHAYGHSHHSQLIVLPCCTASANKTSPQCCLEVTAHNGYRMFLGPPGSAIPLPSRSSLFTVFHPKTKSNGSVVGRLGLNFLFGGRCSLLPPCSCCSWYIRRDELAMLALIRPTEAPSSFRMHNTFSFWLSDTGEFCQQATVCVSAMA